MEVRASDNEATWAVSTGPGTTHCHTPPTTTLSGLGTAFIVSKDEVSHLCCSLSDFLGVPQPWHTDCSNGRGLKLRLAVPPTLTSPIRILVSIHRNTGTENPSPKGPCIQVYIDAVKRTLTASALFVC